MGDDMRVIAGKARRLQLRTVPGMEVRPTTDRTKETLFNIISSIIPQCNFLDLFSGSGAIGIEALSRGAALAVFVENNKAAVQCIKQNLAATHLEADSRIIQNDVLTALRNLEKEKVCFDVVFMDPPYNHNLEMEVLEVLKNSSVISKDTIVIVEASLQTQLLEAEQAGFVCDRVKQYKTNQHIFLSKKVNADCGES